LVVLNRAFNLAVIGSGALFCFAIAACFIAGNIDPRKEFLSLGEGFHLSLNVWESSPRLEIFNDANFGPYSGRIWAVSSPMRGSPTFPKIVDFGFADIYFQLGRWQNGQRLWSLSVSLLYFVVLSAILPIVWLVRHSRCQHRGFPMDTKPKLQLPENPQPQRG
jgi:hypothetical protein